MHARDTCGTFPHVSFFILRRKTKWLFHIQL
nr:MAG TPA: hypothetical protein [Caudoviricetes sp.]